MKRTCFLPLPRSQSPTMKRFFLLIMLSEFVLFCFLKDKLSGRSAEKLIERVSSDSPLLFERNILNNN